MTIPEKIKAAWLFCWSFFDLPGDVILGVYSIAMIGLSCFSVLTGRPFPNAVATAYGLVVSAFASTNIAEFYKNNVEKKTTTTITTSAVEQTKEQQDDNSTDLP